MCEMVKCNAFSLHYEPYSMQCRHRLFNSPLCVSHEAWIVPKWARREGSGPRYGPLKRLQTSGGSKRNTASRLCKDGHVASSAKYLYNVECWMQNAGSEREQYRRSRTKRIAKFFLEKIYIIPHFSGGLWPYNAQLSVAMHCETHC